MKYDIFGIGNTLLDFLINVDDDLLSQYELKKGVMHLLEEDKIHEIVTRFKGAKMVPAGGVTNTCAGIAALGGKALLLGKVGQGEYGAFYEESISRRGVVPRLLRSDKSRTGKVINLVTKDAERTFAVHLGAAKEVNIDAVLEDDVRESAFLYFTGYEFESMNETILHAVKMARRHRVRVAMDLADPELVKRNYQPLKLLSKSVEVLFMNENEALSFTGKGPEEAAKYASTFVAIAIVKAGKSGSYIAANGHVMHVQAFSAEAVDTTGAGDLYAAGFLYSLIRGRTLESAGKLGSYMGAKIVSQVGALLDKKAAGDIRLVFENSG